MKFAALILMATACYAVCTDGWNRTFRYAQPVTVTNGMSTVGITPAHTVDLVFDHAALVSAGKSLASGADVNLRYCDGTSWWLLDRVIDLSTAWNTSTTKVSWRVRATIGPGATDAGYYLFYGNPNASTLYQTLVTPNWVREQIKAKADSLVLIDHSLFSSDSSDFWQAGVIYPQMYAGDTYFTMHGNPGMFTDAQIKNVVQKFVTANFGTGGLPVDIESDATAILANNYSGWDSDHFHIAIDGDCFLTELESIYHARTGDNTFFNSISATLKTALTNIPLDGATHLVNVSATVGQRWIPWLFQDGVVHSGDVLSASVMLYKAARIISQRYTDVGDSTNSATFATMASNIQASLTTSSALWDATDGMFYAATGNNHQIDVIGSAMAVYVNGIYPGFLSGSQVTAISTYLVANYATLVNSQGYIRQSPTNWSSTWGGNMGGYGAGNYDDGYWSHGHEWVAYAMAQTSTAKAVQLITEFANGDNLGVEVYGATANGTTQNMESPQGSLAFIAANPTLFPDTVTSTSLGNDPNQVYWFWDDFTTDKGWIPNQGTWARNSGILQNTLNYHGEGDDPGELTMDFITSHLADGLSVQVDARIDSYTVGDHSTAGPALSVTATAALKTPAYGYANAFRGSTTTTTAMLDINRAWASPTAFSWGTGTFTRAKVGRLGLAVIGKNWAVGSAEPSWMNAYTIATTLSDIDRIGLLSGYSTVSYDNVIVRKLLATEPTVSAGAEVVIAARRRVQ